MISAERLASLQTKHSNIDEMSAKIESAPYADTQKIRQLKREKLRIKEQIFGFVLQSERKGRG